MRWIFDLLVLFLLDPSCLDAVLWTRRDLTLRRCISPSPVIAAPINAISALEHADSRLQGRGT